MNEREVEDFIKDCDNNRDWKRVKVMFVYIYVCFVGGGMV